MRLFLRYVCILMMLAANALPGLVTAHAGDLQHAASSIMDGGAGGGLPAVRPPDERGTWLAIVRSLLSLDLPAPGAAGFASHFSITCAGPASTVKCSPSSSLLTLRCLLTI